GAVTSGEGTLARRWRDLLPEPKPVEDTSWLQLFIKNTALCMFGLFCFLNLTKKAVICCGDCFY
ncbi:hypothetical protein, partial [Pantoea agglomerans]|uniref:hypothetical protein n=1 Tax=Enterobacter agglomerans TaxID=549 RepID=UPI001A8C2506